MPLAASGSSGRASSGQVTSNQRSTPEAARRRRICARPRIRSTTSSNTGSSTTTHTQWCDQDTGDTSSAVNATLTIATASSPRRCASTAEGQTRRSHQQGRDHPEQVAPAVSPKVRSANRATTGSPRSRDRWRPTPATSRGTGACSQNALDARGATSQPARVIATKGAGGHGCRAEAAGQQQVHHEDSGDELAGRGDADASTLEPVPVR